MAKIQSHSGRSLADTYDVVGSVAAIDTLESQTVHLEHEMGSTIFSERLGSSVIIMSTGNLSQSTNFAVTTPLTDMPGLTRLLGIMVYADGDNVEACTLVITNEDEDRDVILYAWDATNDLAIPHLINVYGTYAARTLLRPVTLMGNVPGMAFGPGQRAQMPAFGLHGTTKAFGAGTVEITAHLQIANADTGEPAALSSIGLPLPGW